MHLTYPGYCVDTVLGQVTGPDAEGGRMVATLAIYDPTTNKTRVSFVPLPLGEKLTRDTAGMLRVDPARIDPDGTLRGAR